MHVWSEKKIICMNERNVKCANENVHEKYKHRRKRPSDWHTHKFPTNIIFVHIYIALRENGFKNVSNRYWLKQYTWTMPNGGKRHHLHPKRLCTIGEWWTKTKSCMYTQCDKNHCEHIKIESPRLRLLLFMVKHIFVFW